MGEIHHAIGPVPAELGCFEEMQQSDARDIAEDVEDLLVRKTPPAAPDETGDAADEVGVDGVEKALPLPEKVVVERGDVLRLQVHQVVSLIFSAPAAAHHACTPGIRRTTTALVRALCTSLSK
eukprot:530295-Rhodomonas_salina.1